MSLARNLISSGHARIAIATIAASTQPYKRYLISLSCAISLPFSTPSHRSTVPGRARRASLALPALQYYASVPYTHLYLRSGIVAQPASRQSRSVPRTRHTAANIKPDFILELALHFCFHSTQPLWTARHGSWRGCQRDTSRRRCWADANIIQSAGEFINPLKSVGDFVETCALCFHCHMGDCDV